MRIQALLPGSSPAVGVSILLHGLLGAALLLVPWITIPREEHTAVALVHAGEDLRQPPDPPPPLRARLNPPPLPREWVSREEPPREPPPFPETAPRPVTDTDLPPADLPPSIPTSGRRTVIGGGGGAPPAPGPASPLPPAPPPEKPKATSPVPLEAPPPAYPRRARQREWEGRVLLLVEVLPDGSVGEIRVKESSGHPLLDRAAKRTVRESWIFRPARANGRPVRSLVEVPISFRLTD